MSAKINEKGAVVKIDSNLLLEIEEFIAREENKFKFVNKKQFIDIAVNEYLEKNRKGGKK